MSHSEKVVQEALISESEKFKECYLWLELDETQMALFFFASPPLNQSIRAGIPPTKETF